MSRRFAWIGAVGVLVSLGLFSTLSAAEKGYLGVYLKPSANSDGAIVEQVAAGSPAEAAGLKAGDRIVSVSGITVREPTDLVQVVQAASVGDKLQLALKRGEESVLANVTLMAPPMKAPVEKLPAEAKTEHGFLGVGYAEVHPAVAAHLGLKDGMGVTVGDVVKGSPADKAGIVEHDIILSVDGKEVRGPESFLDILGSKKPGDVVKVEILHQGERKSMEVTLDKRPADLPPAGSLIRSGRLWRPEHARSGRVILEGPNGMRQLFNIPEGDWNLDEIWKHMEDQVAPGEAHDRLMKLFETLREHDTEKGAVSGSHTSAVVKVIDNGMDITIRDEDGVRTVDVRKGDKVLAEKLPWDQLKKLPDDVRQAVEKAAANITVDIQKGVLPTVPSGEKELKA